MTWTIDPHHTLASTKAQGLEPLGFFVRTKGPLPIESPWAHTYGTGGPIGQRCATIIRASGRMIVLGRVSASV
jgi:hypothetical protein